MFNVAAYERKKEKKTDWFKLEKSEAEKEV